MPSEFKSSNRIASIVVCLGLTVGLLAIYGQTASFDFVNWDDDVYIYENPQILKGITAENVVDAFTKGQSHLWHPITTLTHLVDIELYGTNAGGFHLTNLWIHIAASIVLFFAIRQMTRLHYPSAFVAGLFALHPLRVESVAWVTERKDVLTGLFLAILLLAYSYYVRKPSIARYGLVLLAFVLGAMSKPTFVPVPLALLLLDYWPYRRDEQTEVKQSPIGIWGRLILEKTPLLLVSAVTSLLTIQIQSAKAMVSLSQLTLNERLVNAGRSYGIYLTQFFWPHSLAAYYKLDRNEIAFWQGIAGWGVVIALTAIVLRYSKQLRYLAVGWLWFLTMMIPTIGLLQAGTQSHADRFTYLPQIGLAIAMTWALSDISRIWRLSRPSLLFAALSLLCILSVASWSQTRYWQNGVTLFSRAIDVGVRSEVVYSNLGIALEKEGRSTEATEMFRRSVELNSSHFEGLVNYGDSLRAAGEYERAVPLLERALQIRPDNKDVANNLATSLIQLGRLDEAILRLEEARKRHPSFAETLINLGLIRFRQNKVDEAIADYRKALEINPESPGAYSNLAIALASKNLRMEAIDAFRASLRLRPEDVNTLMSAAWIVATSPDAPSQTFEEGLAWAKQGMKLTDGRNPKFLMMLAGSLAATNRFDEALLIAEKAEQLALQQGDTSIAEAIRTHKVLYQQKQPVR